MNSTYKRIILFYARILMFFVERLMLHTEKLFTAYPNIVARATGRLIDVKLKFEAFMDVIEEIR